MPIDLNKLAAIVEAMSILESVESDERDASKHLDYLLSRSLSDTAGVLMGLAGAAVTRLLSRGASAMAHQRLFTDEELAKLTQAYSASNGTANLLARATIRNQQEKLGVKHGDGRLARGDIGKSSKDVSKGMPGLQSWLGNLQRDANRRTSTGNYHTLLASKEFPTQNQSGHIREELTVPVRQQQESWRCGAAALRACLAAHGMEVSEDDLAERLGTTKDKGTQPKAIIAVASSLCCQVHAQHGMSISYLKGLTSTSLISDGNPVICAVTMHGGGHYVVVQEISVEQNYSTENGNGSQMSVIIMDPARGEGHRKLPLDDFENVWHSTDWRGRQFIRYGIAIGPPHTKESRIMEELTSPEKPLTPWNALNYFLSLFPRIGINPLRWGEDMRRKAFTLAWATGTKLLEDVQGIIRDILETGQKVSAAPAMVSDVLLRAGVAPANPQFAELIIRTNLMDSYNQGWQDEMTDPDIQDMFPVWMYSNPHDSRSRPEHAARDGNYYPASRTFNSVRGTDVGDIVNCRCVPISIDKWEWQKLEAQGKRLAT